VSHLPFREVAFAIGVTFVLAALYVLSAGPSLYFLFPGGVLRDDRVQLWNQVYAPLSWVNGTPLGHLLDVYLNWWLRQVTEAR
jgi:hypothetical protein